MIRPSSNWKTESDTVEEVFSKWLKSVLRLPDSVQFFSSSRCCKNCMWEDKIFFEVAPCFFAIGSGGKSVGVQLSTKSWDASEGSVLCSFDKSHPESSNPVNVFSELPGSWACSWEGESPEMERNASVIFL